jgi:hypothetical protein
MPLMTHSEDDWPVYLEEEDPGLIAHDPIAITTSVC